MRITPRLTMPSPDQQSAPEAKLWSASFLYQLVLALAGWSVFALLAGLGASQANWIEIAIFAVLSIGTKRLGFQVAPHVTHSLVGIVDLAALFSMGPFGAATVSCVSSGICKSVLCGSDQNTRSLDDWRTVAFVSGISVLKVTAASWAYSAAGGTIPLTVISWLSLLSVLAAGVVWFLVDHTLWFAYEWLRVGHERALRFLRRILPYSISIELVPLPLAAAISGARHSSVPLFLLICASALGAGLVVRALVVLLDKERRHVRELSTIQEVGRQLLDTRLDVRRVSALIYQACSQITDAPVFALRLLGSDGRDVSEYVTIDGQEISVDPQLLRTETTQSVLQSQESLCVEAFDETKAPIKVGPPAKSGLYIPIVQEEAVLGLIAVQSPDPNAYNADDRDVLELLASQAAIGLQTARLYQQERQRSAQLVAISHVTRQVASLQPLPQLMADTVQWIAENFAYYHVTLFTSDTENKQIICQAASSPYVQERGLTVPWGSGIVGVAAETGHTLLVNDARNDPRFREDAALPETCAEIAVPLAVEDRILGILDVQSDICDAFGESDVFVLETLASQIAIAVEDSRLYEDQQEQAWVSTALQQVAEAITSLTEPEAVLNTVARLALMFGGIDRCAIFVWYEAEGAFTAVAGEGWPISEHDYFEGHRTPAGTSPLLDRVRQEDETLITPAEDLYDALPERLIGDTDSRRVIGIPLHIKGQQVGVLVADGLAPSQQLTEHRQAILEGIARHAALGLESTRLYAAQREEARVSTALLRVANSVPTSLNLGEVVSTVTRLVPTLVGLDWCAILVWDEESQTFALRQGHALPDDHLAAVLPDQGPYRDLDAIRTLLTCSEPQILAGASAAALIPSLDGTADLGTVAVLPLHARARPLGLMLGGQRHATVYGETSLAILSTIASQTSLAIEAAHLYAQTVQQQRIEREIELAREIQESFLPEACPQIPGWDIAVEWRAARGVGGDFYDFVRLGEHHLGLVIADVSDKGVGAALYMALSRTVLRAAALDATGPADALRRANRILVDDNRSGMFVSMLYGVLDTRTGLLRYGRAGHNPGLWIHAETQTVDNLCPPGIVLGITENPEIAEATVTLEPGDALVLYTDGVTDALDKSENEFGEQRLIDCLRDIAPSRADRVVQQVNHRVSAFSSGAEQFDDFTLLAVTRQAAMATDQGPGVRFSATQT